MAPISQVLEPPANPERFMGDITVARDEIIASFAPTAAKVWIA
jgi:hypothetical protein